MNKQIIVFKELINFDYFNLIKNDKLFKKI